VISLSLGFHSVAVLDVVAVFQTLPTTRGRTGEGLGMSPRNVYMSDSMPNRSGSHRGVVARPYMDTAPAVSASAAGRSDIPSMAGGGPIQSGTMPRRRGIFTSLGKGFVTTVRGGRGISSTSAPNLGDNLVVRTPACLTCTAWPDDNPA